MERSLDPCGQTRMTETDSLSTSEGEGEWLGGGDLNGSQHWRTLRTRGNEW